MNIKKELPNIKENVLLKNFTTFRIGGPAKYFLVAKKKEELIKAISLAKKLKIPFFIFGGGSNLLVADEGFKGLIIKIQNSKFKIQNSKIVAEAGTILGQLVSASVKSGLTGLEWAIGIPGTVGGAIWGNAGAFGKSMADVTKTVTVFEIKNQKSKIKILKNKDCKFGYRESIFRHKKNLIIFSAIIQLKKGKKSEIKKKIKKYLEYRKKTQPLNFPSAGSVFKNPPGFFAAKLIEECGLKGKKIGGAKISEKHANFILNLGRAKAKDVLKLIKLIKEKVKKKFGIVLKEEICYLNLDRGSYNVKMK
jgi:UDP-N-acetylmuramate dehydrogenase